MTIYELATAKNITVEQIKNFSLRQKYTKIGHKKEEITELGLKNGIKITEYMGEPQWDYERRFIKQLSEDIKKNPKLYINKKNNEKTKIQFKYYIYGGIILLIIYFAFFG